MNVPEIRLALTVSKLANYVFVFLCFRHFVDSISRHQVQIRLQAYEICNSKKV